VIAGVRIFVPTRGWVRVDTVVRLAEIMGASPELPPVLYQVGADIVSGRNGIVRRFLGDANARVLVMNDDDVRPPDDLLDGLALLDDHGIVAFPTPIMQQGNARLALGPRLPDGSYKWAGTGCIAVRRDVLEALGPDPFRYEGGMHFDYGAIGLSTSAGEDLAFCRDARAAGYTIAAAHEHPAQHHVRQWL
jgi:hypothetical protein